MSLSHTFGSRHPFVRLAAAAGLAVSLLAPAASAQYALGDGRALDSNQRVGSGGVNARQSSLSAGMALRNAVVTGNVAGGRHFRGDVGYTGVFDFRGDTAEDDLFDFRRDSYFSGLAARGVRGIDDVRAQLGLTTNNPAFGLGGNVAIRRPTTGAFSAEARDQIASGDVTPALDLFPRLDGTLRSTSGYQMREIDRPEMLSRRVTEQGFTLVTTASSLGGIRELPTSNQALYGPMEAVGPIDPAARAGADSLDVAGFTAPTAAAELVGGASVTPNAPADDPMSAALREFTADDRAQPDDASTSAGRPDNRVSDRVDNARAGAQVASSGRVGHRQVLENLRRSALDTGLLDRIRERRAAEDAALAQADAEAEAAESDDIGRMLEDISRTLSEGRSPGFDERGNVVPDDRRDADDQADDERTDDPASTDDEDSNRPSVATILRGGDIQLDGLDLDLEGSSPAVVRHMARGERWLEEGRWFDAEERFTAALSIEPGLAPALIGRVHAQIGAGLYASAALNLRQMLRDYPEFIAVKYPRNILPAGERLQTIRDQLVERMNRNEVIARDAAMLFAFLGYQTDRPQDVLRGFERLRAVEDTLDLEPDPLDALLFEVWRPE